MGQARVREILTGKVRVECSVVELLPDAVQDVAIGIDSYINIRDDYLVLLGLLLVTKERVWHPHLGRVGQGQVVQFT